MLTKIKHFFINAICGLVWGRDRRRHVRTVLKANVGRCLRFIKHDMGARPHKVKISSGFMGRNIVIIADDKWAYKFPVASENHNAKALREKRIVDALRSYCPVHVPSVELLTMRANGMDIIVRKYEFVRGCTVREMNPNIVMKNLDSLAKQIARTVYEISRADPAAIRDLKPTPGARTGYMRGWTQGDICDNFMVDEDTMKLVAYIDWEDAHFGSFQQVFSFYKRSPEKELMTAAAKEYDRIWNAQHSK